MKKTLCLLLFLCLLVLPTGCKPQALPETPAFKTVELPFNEEISDHDMDGDGEADPILLQETTDADGFYTPVTVYIGDAALIDDSVIGTYDNRALLTDLDPADGLLDLLLCGDTASSDYLTRCFYYQDGQLYERSFTNLVYGGAPQPGYYGYLIDAAQGEVQLYRTAAILGTRNLRISCSLKDGILTEHSGLWEFDYGITEQEELWEYCALITKAELPVLLDGQETTLPAGTRILLTATDHRTVVEFVTEDGEVGRIAHLQYLPASYCTEINGKNEGEWFESIPYAG